MAVDYCASRRQAALAALKARDLKILLVTNETNVRYLTGFTGDSTWLILSREKTVLISDGRYVTQLAEECPGLEAVIRPISKNMTDAAAEILHGLKRSAVGFESASLTVAQFEKLRDAVSPLELTSVGDLVETLRMIKDPGEISQIRTAVQIAQKSFAAAVAQITPEMTERTLAHELEHTMRRLGAIGAAFPPIVGVGDRAALPHYRPENRKIGEAGFVLIDWGTEGPTGYRSDLTRVLATSKISPKLEKIYRVVLSAQQAGIEAIGPGVRCCDVDRAARAVIEAAGYRNAFTHSLGHGIGLDIHEQPRLSSVSEMELKPGMVVTVEPGVYLPGWGGVRIEDDVLVTDDGYELLTSVPKDLDSIQL